MIKRFTSFVAKYWKTYLVVILLLALIIWAILLGYSAAWTGFSDYTKPNGDFMRGKTLWDWMQLFIIPIFLSVGAFLLNLSERNNERQKAETERESERKRAEERTKLEREIATDRQQEAAFQSYIDRMADLLLKEKLRSPENKEARDVARTRTLSVLRGLDGNRKGLLLRFIYEANLVNKKEPVIDLEGADLMNADLRQASLNNISLRGADLSGVNLNGAILRNADLRDAILVHSDIVWANLHNVDATNAKISNANLFHIDLSGANLAHVWLSGSDLRKANLSDATLVDANLKGAKLFDANITGADLSDAYLNEAEISNEQLATAKSLKGATLPDGTVHD